MITSLQQYLTFSRSKTHTHKKKNWRPRLKQNKPKSGPKLVFHFVKSGSSVFLEIAFDDCLELCLTNSRSKTYKKSSGSKIGQKLRLSPFSQICIISFSWYCTGLQLGTRQCLTSSRAETSEKIAWSKLGCNRPKLGLKWVSFFEISFLLFSKISINLSSKTLCKS